uniref:Uncharacterized protein n=1 Tax=Toxoplasma gondii (strain ATCC 50861 / VEG) TaxID=432359 RepID=A0A0F7V202_TOXGV|nr:TPA: hypothetical protein BN1205_067590 [Toxoplasma gondii VEG]
MHYCSLQPWIYGVRRYSEGSRSDVGVRNTSLPTFSVLGKTLIHRLKGAWQHQAAGQTRVRPVVDQRVLESRTYYR